MKGSGYGIGINILVGLVGDFQGDWVFGLVGLEATKHYRPDHLHDRGYGNGDHANTGDQEVILRQDRLFCFSIQNLFQEDQQVLPRPIRHLLVVILRSRVREGVCAVRVGHHLPIGVGGVHLRNDARHVLLAHRCIRLGMLDEDAGG